MRFKKKKVIEPETLEELTLLHANCDNCGAPLKYNKDTLECKCDYCKTEYYIERHGESNITLMGELIRLNLHGVERTFYVGSEEYHPISEHYINTRGQMVYNTIARKCKVTLIEI